MTSWVSSIRRTTRYGRSGRLGVDPGLLVEAGLFGDELGGEQPVDLVPGVGDLGGDRVTEHLADSAEQVVADDGVLLGPDAQRDVFVGNAFHDMIERRGGGVDQLDGVGHHGGGQRPGLFAGGLVALVEDSQQFRVFGEHPRIEPSGDLLGMSGNDSRGGGDDGGGPVGQQ